MIVIQPSASTQGEIWARDLMQLHTSFLTCFWLYYASLVCDWKIWRSVSQTRVWETVVSDVWLLAFWIPWSTWTCPLLAMASATIMACSNRLSKRAGRYVCINVFVCLFAVVDFRFRAVPIWSECNCHLDHDTWTNILYSMLFCFWPSYLKCTDKVTSMGDEMIRLFTHSFCVVKRQSTRWLVKQLDNVP